MVEVYHIGLGVNICRPAEKREKDIYLLKYSLEALDLIWPTIEPWLQHTLTQAPPWWTVGDLYGKCKRGELVAWVACIDNKPYGVLLTGIDVYEKAKVVGVPWIGGSKMLVWIETANEIIEAWAKAAGCSYMTGSGRAGWGKLLNMKDYGPTLIKELTQNGE